MSAPAPQSSGQVVLALIFGLMAIFVVTRCSNGSAPTPPTSQALDIAMVSHQFEYLGGGTARITGTITNRSDRTAEMVIARFNVYDSGGAQVGDTLATVNNLEPHRDWKFEAKIFNAAARTHKFIGIESVAK